MRINAYNLVFLDLWNANMDLQLLLDPLRVRCMLYLILANLSVVCREY